MPNLKRGSTTIASHWVWKTGRGDFRDTENSVMEESEAKMKQTKSQVPTAEHWSEVGCGGRDRDVCIPEFCSSKETLLLGENQL